MFMSGGSRGIGLAIAVRAARDGANVALIAKTTEPHPKLEGTIYTAAEQIQAPGGMAAEYAQDGIAFNSLWPRTIIATAAVQNLLGGDEAMARSRKPEILADSAHAILVRDSHECTGNFFIDDEVLAEEGVTDLSDYGYGDGAELQTDIFLDA